MHIAHLTTMRDYYGGEVCLVNLAEGMARRGHRVSCVVRPDSRLRTQLAGRGVDVRLLPLVDWFEPLGTARLGLWLRQAGVDVLHTHLPRDWFIAAAATVGTDVRNVGTRHLLHPIAHAGLKRPFMRRFSAMIAVSGAVHQVLEASGLVAPERIVTVPNGIPTAPAIAAAGGSGLLRRLAGAAPDDPVIGAVGRLCPEKNLETLLLAAAALRARWPRLRVFILGDAPRDAAYLLALRRLGRRLGLDGVVTFFGYQDDAASLCAEFDVQVVCSRAEPFGLVTLEAMAQARPVVVTDRGGSPEIVRDGREGFLVAPGDVEALARRLDRLLGDPRLRASLGRRGRLRVERQFNRDLMLDRVEELYRRLVPAARVPRASVRRDGGAARREQPACTAAGDQVAAVP